MQTLHVEIAVIGASLGGTQAALSACRMGQSVYLCEETDWLGGQMTAQAVPPDENPWIEAQGAPKSYLAYRRAVRNEYQQMPDASPLLKEQKTFCPGHSWVSRLAHDPRIANKLLLASLVPYIKKGLLTLEYHTVCYQAQTQEDQIQAVFVRNVQSGEQTRVVARYYLDGTDCGDLLPLTGTEYSLGAESREQTGEPHASAVLDREDVQPITWVAALELTKTREPMKKPEGYEEFAHQRILNGEHPLFSWYAPDALTGGSTRFSMFDGEQAEHPLGLWSYRRIQYPPYFTTPKNEISLLNWPQNDYSESSVIDVPDARKHLERARQLTLSAAYWLWEQGYPVRLCKDILGTEDGLAKAPYIRESRRIIAKETIREQDVSAAFQKTPPRLSNSVGVGYYPIDVHRTVKSHFCLYAPVQPFEIPLGALLPVRVKNLLPACKNIGTTHITNACCRLHPIEWTIGEAAGTLAAFCCVNGVTPYQVQQNELSRFQQQLLAQGAQLHWML